MNQRVFNLAKWTRVGEGELMFFANDRRRMVTLEVNAPAETRLYVQQRLESLKSNPERLSDEEAGRDVRPVNISTDEDGDALTFLARVFGRDSIEFGVDGAFSIMADGGEVYIWSSDSEDIATRVIAPIIFTKLMNRRPRNPAMEMMEYQMRQNQLRFASQIREESERRIRALEAKLEEYAPERAPRRPERLLQLEREADAARRENASDDDGEDVTGASGSGVPSGELPDDDPSGGGKAPSGGKKAKAAG